MKTGISIGVDAVVVKASQAAILAILESGAEQETLRCALAALGTTCSVNGTMVTNCMVYGDGPPKKKSPKK